MDQDEKKAVAVIISALIIGVSITVVGFENIPQQPMTPLYRLLVFYDKVREEEFVPTDTGFTNQTLYYKWYANFTAKMVLHDTNERNYFQEYSNLYFPTSSYLANKTLFDLLGYYWKSSLQITDLEWRIENTIFYKNTSDLYGNEYPRFPVETALTRLGECKDIAMLDSALLKSNGYQTILAVVGDPNYNNGSGLYHEFLFVRIADNFSDANNTLSSWIPSFSGGQSRWIDNGLGNITNLLWSWNIDGHSSDYVWLMLDPTSRSESQPVGSQASFVPSWFTWYISNNKMTELEDHLFGAIVSVNQTVTSHAGVPH